MKKYLLAISFIFCMKTIIAQPNTTFQPCGTENIDTTEFQDLPWFDNNPFLEHFLDSIGYPAANSNANRIVGAPSVRFWIPIKFWIYGATNGLGGPNQTQIQLMVDKLNDLFNVQNNTQIGFYLKCDPSIVNLVADNITFLQAVTLLTTFNEKGCLNVHIVNNLTYASGMTMKPLSINACIVNSFTYSRNNSTLAHEIGHVLGLIHTHLWWDVQYLCYRECVSRTRTWGLAALVCKGKRLRSRYVCESTGDALGDTQADPELSTNNSCNYLPQSGIFANDLWGDSYSTPPNGPQEIPNTHNVMSYNADDACVTEFSRLQIGVMLYNILFKKNPIDVLGWSNPRTTFDSYEPDNISNTARTIVAGEIQERNFHQQYNREPLQGFYSQCDVDWVRFFPNLGCNSNLSITTSAILNKTNADTRLTLFNSTLVQLAQNDNISASNLYSSLNFNFVSGQEYFIRVENMQNLVTGYYNLLVGSEIPTKILGADYFCSGSSTFNIPNGIPFNWSINPSVGIVNITSSTSNSITLTKTGNGFVTLKATSNDLCLTNQVTLTKVINVGVPKTNFKLSSIHNLNTLCGWDVTLSNFCNATGFVWQDFTPLPYTNELGLIKPNFLVAENIEYGQIALNYSIAAVNQCGTGNFITKNIIVPAPWRVGGCNISAKTNQLDNKITLFPNPSSNLIAVNKNDNIGFTEIRIIDKFGAIKKYFRFPKNSKNATIDIFGLPTDIYQLQIFDGVIWSNISFSKL